MRHTKQLLMACLILALTFAATAMPFSEKQTMDDPPIIIRPLPLPAPNSPHALVVVPISAEVIGNNLSVTFTGNLGEVEYELVNLSTMEFETDQVEGTGQVLIPFSGDSGSYTITFTLSNGVQYYGQFIL